jgi:CcmD family protein
MLKIILTLSFIFGMIHSSYAESQAIDFLRSTGKIYSVVGVIVIIFLGLAIYLWRIDRKLTKLENHIKDE